jgi:hypothetical protein
MREAKHEDDVADHGVVHRVGEGDEDLDPYRCARERSRFGKGEDLAEGMLGSSRKAAPRPGLSAS